MDIDKFKKYINGAKLGYVKITKAGQLILNSKWAHEFNLGSEKNAYAIFLFNEEDRQIGLRFTNDPQEPGSNLMSFRVTVPFNSNAYIVKSASMYCVSLLRANNICPSDTYKAKAEAQGEYLIINVNEKID